MGFDYSNDKFIGIVIGPDDRYYEELSSIFINGEDDEEIIFDAYTDRRVFGIPLILIERKYINIIYYRDVNIVKYEDGLDYDKSYIKFYMNKYNINTNFYKLFVKLYNDDTIKVNRYSYTYVT